MQFNLRNQRAMRTKKEQLFEDEPLLNFKTKHF